MSVKIEQTSLVGLSLPLSLSLPSLFPSPFLVLLIEACETVFQAFHDFHENFQRQISQAKSWGTDLEGTWGGGGARAWTLNSRILTLILTPGLYFLGQPLNDTLEGQ